MKDKDLRGNDKGKHFGVCLALAIVCAPLAVVCAIVKEVYDKRKGGHFCVWDIVADTFGIVCGVGVDIALWLLFVK